MSNIIVRCKSLQYRKVGGEIGYWDAHRSSWHNLGNVRLKSGGMCWKIEFRRQKLVVALLHNIFRVRTYLWG